MKRNCIYCGKEKAIDKFSLEHILPSSLSGSLVDNPFTTNDVCIRCNELAGQFIDAPFVKSWHINMDRAGHFKKYCDPTKTDIVPLTFMGTHNTLKYENKICDDWFGPTGDVIYHFHEPYPEEPNTPAMIGVPNTAWKKKIDKGFVFLFIKSNNPAWYRTIFLSVLKQFSDTPIYLGNGVKPSVRQFEEIPDYLKVLHQNLLDNVNGEQSVTVSMSIDFNATRFLSKLALGLGYKLFDSLFIDSNEAKIFRDVMWERDPAHRRKSKLHGTFPPNKNEMDDMLKWKDGHCIALTNINGMLGLYANFYGGHHGYSLMIAETSNYWKEMDNNGVVYIIAPAFGKVIGPISFSKYVLYNNIEQNRVAIDELDQLKKEFNEFVRTPTLI